MEARASGPHGTQLLGNLLELRQVPFLMLPDEEDPLIEVDLTEDHVWMSHFAECAGRQCL